MKLIFNKSTLQKAIAPALCAIASNTSIPATEGIQFKADDMSNQCQLTSFDLSKGVRSTIEAQVIKGGSVIINASKLSQIVKAMPGDITIDVDSNYVAKISSGRSEFSIHVLPGEDFPNLPELRGDRGFEISQKTLKKMISQTIYAAAINDMRPALNGEFIKIQDNQITMVSCDSFRIAIKEEISEIGNKCAEKGEMNFSFIVPTKTMSELHRLLSDDEDAKVTVLLSRKHVIFFLDDLIFFSRLIDSEYIDYARFIPNEFKTTCIIEKDELLGSLERASLVTEDRTLGQEKGPVKLSFQENSLVVSSVSVSGTSFDEIHTQNTGDMLTIGFNCRYLMDSIRATDSEKIKLSLISPLMSMIVEPVYGEDENPSGKFIFAVTPVRMKDTK